MTKTRRLLLRIGLGCGALIVLASLFWLTTTWWAKRDFEAAVGELRAAGMIVDLEQLNQPPVPDDENAAVLLMEAMNWRKENDLEECSATYGLDHDAEFDTDAWSEIAEWIEAQTPFFDGVERALRRPHCNFSCDWTQGWATRVESIPVSSQIADAYEWRVRLAVYRDEPAETALGYCSTVFSWSPRIDRTCLIAYLVRCTVDGAACEMLKRVAGMREFDATAARAALEPLLIAAEDRSALRDAMAGERAIFVRGVRRMATWEGLLEVGGLAISEMEVPNSFRIAMTALRPLVWRDGQRTLELWARAEAIMERGGVDALAELEALVREYRWTSGDSAVAPLWRLLSSLIVHLPEKAYESRLKHLAHLRVARVGLACLAHRQQTGAWPADSGGILDPFTERPLKLEREGDTVCIEAAVPWLDGLIGEFRDEQRIYWTLR